MKRYLSLVLALVLALAVFCGVSVFAEDADVNRIPPTCVHLWSEPSQSVSTRWDIVNCKEIKTITETQTCPLCGEVKETIYTQSEPKHSLVYESTIVVNGSKRSCYRCEVCGAYRYVPVSE